MDYSDAMQKLNAAYRDRDDELRTVFMMCDFSNKKIAEIGAGSEGYFIKVLLNHTPAKNIIATDISWEILDMLRKNVNVKTKKCYAHDLHFFDQEVDVAFSRWALHDVEDVEAAINDMCRIARKNVFVVIPSEEGDETEFKSIVDSETFQRRVDRISDIKKALEKNFFDVKEKKKILNFVFRDIEEAAQVLAAAEFRNKIKEDHAEKLYDFLERRKKMDGIHFTQGAAFICGTRMVE